MTRKLKAVSQENRMYLLEYYMWWVSVALGDISLWCVCVNKDYLHTVKYDLC
jgi:hypothetical protein